MKVHLIKSKTVRDYAKEHASAISSFERWINQVESADWDTPNEISDDFATADLLGKKSNRVVFDIGGNNYRIICSYYFNNKIDTVTLFVKWIGTHADYSKLESGQKQYTVDEY